ncbi:MAG: WG repeat-containing protein [Barnesiella sp.]|nr:WG repeat-containing protein [Barnesiella sp.]
MKIIQEIGEHGQYVYGYADDSGKVVIEPQYDNAMPFVDGLAFVEDNCLWKVIDEKGVVVSTAIIGNIVWSSFSEDVYVASEPCDVNKRGKCGYINREGHWVIKPIYLRACPFKDGYAKVMTASREWILIDKDEKHYLNP